ncbi:hypothetical protein [Lentibacillus salinarum]|uniref:Flp family type IVb pilin n=1 Tax=Lentibacillus salinarum TaxID=446820 RepID=A0ABW3ZWT8_9BACI
MYKVMSYVLAFLIAVKDNFSLQNIHLKARDNRAQTWMEYGMIIGGIILIIVLVIGLFGDQLMQLFNSITDAIGIKEPSGSSGGGW